MNYTFYGVRTNASYLVPKDYILYVLSFLGGWVLKHFSPLDHVRSHNWRTILVVCGYIHFCYIIIASALYPHPQIPIECNQWSVKVVGRYLLMNNS